MFVSKWGLCFKKLLLFVLSFGLWSVSAVPVYAAVVAAAEEPLSSGVVLNTYWYEGVKVYVVEVDLSNKYVKVDTIVGADGTLSEAQKVTEMAERTGAAAGINGGFFIMKNHYPIGLIYHDGTMVASPIQRRDMPGFGITKDNSVIMDFFGFSGAVYAENGNSFPLFGVNKPAYNLEDTSLSDINNLNLYTRLWGEKSRDENISYLTGVVEVIVQNGKVTAVNGDKPGVPIPEDGYVLEGHGTAAQFLLDNLKVGTKVNVEYTVTPDGANLKAAVGGNTLLVENGEMAEFTETFYGKHARTAAGISPDGKTLYLVTVEKSVQNPGMTEEELANFMISLGVERGINLDGGGSTTLAVRHLGDFNASLVNQPQAGLQRLVPDALGVYSTAPKGDLAGLIIDGPDLVWVGTSRSYSVKGYDEYYNPYLVNLEKVSWRAEPGGKFEGGLFTPRSGGEAKLTAELNGVEAEKSVKVLGTEDISAINVEPGVISVEPGSAVPLKFSAGAKSGEVFDLTAEEVQASLSGDVGTLEVGTLEVGKLEETTFTAGQTPGAGELTVSFQGLKKVVPITVRDPGSIVQLQPGNSTSLNLDESTELIFPAGAVEASLELKARPGEEVQIPGFKVLKVFEVFNPQDEDMSLGIPWRLQYSNNGALAKEPPALAILYKGAGSMDWVLQPALLEPSEQDQKTAVTARIKGLGQVAVAVDERPAESFSDIKGHWSQKTVEEMASLEIVNGYPNGTFNPEKAVTRAEFVTLLYRALLWSKVGEKASFKDTLPDWAADAVTAAVSRGAVSGYPDGSFRPDRDISRAEMAVIIDRVLKLPEVSGQQEILFYDEDTIPTWSVDSVNRAAAAGILSGDNGYFRPDDSTTRAEVAAAISRVLKYWIKN